MEERKFCIDFFELSFLMEACIPPRPIARSMFWKRVIDEHYDDMSELERRRLWEWINRNDAFKDGVKKGNEDCLLFNARFDPDNQYKVRAKNDNEEQTSECFLWKGRYHLNSTTSILDEYVVSVNNIDVKKI